MPKPLLSIIIPAYNEENRLPDTLKLIFEFLQTQPYLAEVLVIENGSQDRTFEVASEYTHQYPQLKVIHEPGKGKGLAVQRGMLEATGEFRFMCDADLSMPIAEVNRFLPPQLDNFDVAIASREASGAIRYNEPGYRHWGGRGVNLLIRLLAIPGLRDTQCGFKMFRAEVADDLFRCQTILNWSFDIEVLFIARLRGYLIKEIAIPWYFNADTKLNPFNDAAKMVADILKIHQNARRGRYAPSD
jgi:dolichyl-phosphate beta-glucosyltransferase